MKTLCMVSPDFNDRFLKVKERKSTSLQRVSLQSWGLSYGSSSPLSQKTNKQTKKPHKTLKFRAPKYNGKLRDVFGLLKD